jgi:hypothetical protein
MVVCVFNILFIVVGYCGVLVCCFSVCGCCYYLFFWVYRRFICLSIVYYICLSVLFRLSGGADLACMAYYFNASRALSICTWRASMSSALSIYSSSVSGSTVSVTVFANVGLFVIGLGCYFVLSCTSVLDTGLSRALPTLARSITLRSVPIGDCYG